MQHSRLRKIYRNCIIAAVFFISCSGNESAANKNADAANQYTAGENIFTANCAVCHKPDADFIGPSLKDVSARWDNKEMLRQFIKNSADVIPRNEYAKKLFERYRQSPMPAFPQLTESDIDAILSYCNAKN